MVCSLCGHKFDPSDNQACSSCPLNKGCQLVCCPSCGYEMVDVQQSGTVRMVRRLFSRKGKKLGKAGEFSFHPEPPLSQKSDRRDHRGKPWKRFGKRRDQFSRPKHQLNSELPYKTVLNMLPGESATIKEFAPGISSEQKAHLQSYGVVPGHLVQVLRHSPVTILQVDELELALEDKLANSIRVSG